METAQIGIEVDSTKVTEATKALNDFAMAADRARLALEELGLTLTMGIEVEQKPDDAEIN